MSVEYAEGIPDYGLVPAAEYNDLAVAEMAVTSHAGAELVLH